MLKNIIGFIVLAFILGCKNAPQTTSEENNASIVDEFDIYNIPLTEEIANPSTEISGLTWFNDNLIVLPQYAIPIGDSVGYLFSITKEAILKSIETKSSDPIAYTRLRIIGANLAEFLSDGSGFEAITFNGNDVYCSLEKSSLLSTESYLIKGEYDSLNQTIVLDKNSMIKIESASGIDNHGEEAISIWKNKIFTIHESNGKNLVKVPQINLLDLNLNHKGFLRFPHIEYRITDVTKPDSNGVFWALNYFWPGDFNEQPPAEDSLVIKYGIGESQKRYATVERIVEMQFTEEGVKLTGTAPIQFKLLEKDVSRNWEGIVKLENKGFLIITDTFPTTILGFVEYSGK